MTAGFLLNEREGGGGEADRQKDGLTDGRRNRLRRTGRQTCRQAGRQTDKQAGRQAGRQVDSDGLFDFEQLVLLVKSV